MPTFRLDLEYDGGDFRGWQSQAGGRTVQQALESALETVLREPTGVMGAGRTDKGVHARGQVAHFRTNVEVDPYRLRRSLEGVLPPSICVLQVSAAIDGFHARFDAMRRAYRYQVATQPRAIDRHCRWRLHPAPDFDCMNRVAAVLLGAHDFSAFCIAASGTRNRRCAVERALWVPEERPGDWRFEMEANRFLHGMVRAVVGTLVDVGTGRREEADVSAALESRDRRRAGRSAPAHGLVLERVDYPDGVARSGRTAAPAETPAPAPE